MIISPPFCSVKGSRGLSHRFPFKTLFQLSVFSLGVFLISSKCSPWFIFSVSNPADRVGRYKSSLNTSCYLYHTLQYFFIKREDGRSHVVCQQLLSHSIILYLISYIQSLAVRDLAIAHGLFQKGNPPDKYTHRMYLHRRWRDKITCILRFRMRWQTPTLMKKVFATHENCYSLAVDFRTWGSRIVASSIRMADHWMSLLASTYLYHLARREIEPIGVFQVVFWKIPCLWWK